MAKYLETFDYDDNVNEIETAPFGYRWNLFGDDDVFTIVADGNSQLRSKFAINAGFTESYDNGDILILEWLIKDKGTPLVIDFGAETFSYTVGRQTVTSKVSGFEIFQVSESMVGLVDDPVYVVVKGGAADEEFYGAEGVSVKFLGGAGEDDLYGSANTKDILKGGAGRDHLYGGGGLDKVYGGKGPDNVEIDLDGVHVKSEFYGGAGYDNVDLRWSGRGVTLDLAAGTIKDTGTGEKLAKAFNGFEDLNVRSDQALTVYGTDDDNEIYGSYGENTLYGRKGFDILVGYDEADYLNGGKGDDVLGSFGGDDVLIGGGGDDQLYGFEGADQFKGGRGADEFHLGEDADADIVIYTSRKELSAEVESSDVVYEFNSDHDRFDFFGYDANRNTAAQETFAFSAFGAAAHAIWVEVDGENSLVYGDDDGDAVADFVIRVDGVTDLDYNNFFPEL